MWVGVITLFPEMFQALHAGITGRALKKTLISLNYFNPRDFTHDKHHTVDDKTYGGGPGMLMKTEPLSSAIQAAKAASPHNETPVIYLSPQGKLFSQTKAEQTATLPAIILVAGRYEGIDQRVIDHYIDEEWSIGDYILTGGELPAMVVLDTITRLIPGVIGDETSITLDSLTSGLLKHPQYTRPERVETDCVPAVLLSGNHQHIETWRLQESLGNTWLKRPDLLIKRGISPEEIALLQDYLAKQIILKKK